MNAAQDLRELVAKWRNNRHVYAGAGIRALAACADELEAALTAAQGDHSQCGFSTGICGNITAGTGTLDDNGYWERPCKECTQQANASSTPPQRDAVAWAATGHGGAVEALGFNQSRRFDTPLYTHPAPPAPVLASSTPPQDARKERDPQQSLHSPAPVTDAMVERAEDAYYDIYDGTGNNHTAAMRHALEAAFGAAP